MSSYVFKTPTEMVGYLRRKGSESGNRIAATLEAQQAAIELAHGLLWGTPVDTRTPEGLRSRWRARRYEAARWRRPCARHALARKVFEAARYSRKNSRTGTEATFNP